MNKNTMKDHWKELKGKIKEQWGKLTGAEIDQLDGTYEELVGTLQKRYGCSKETARNEINKFLETLH